MCVVKVCVVCVLACEMCCACVDQCAYICEYKVHVGDMSVCELMCDISVCELCE